MAKGMVGIQGPLYEGTGCFHRRKVIYGSNRNDSDENAAQPISLSNLVEMAYKVADCDYEHGTHWGKTVGIRKTMCEVNHMLCINLNLIKFLCFQVGWLYGSKN